MKSQNEKVVKVQLVDIEANLRVGSEVFEVRVVNSRGTTPCVYTVLNIGNKYFTVGVEGQPWTHNKYEIETGKHYNKVYGPQYALYSSASAYERRIELGRKLDEIQKTFSWSNSHKLTDDQLERIYKIITEEKA